MALILEEVARELRSSCEVVRRMCFEGKLRSQKVGGEWRIHDNAVEEFFNQAQNVKREALQPETVKWQSTNVAKRGISTSKLTDAEYINLLKHK